MVLLVILKLFAVFTQSSESKQVFLCCCWFHTHELINWQVLKFVSGSPQSKILCHCETLINECSTQFYRLNKRQRWLGVHPPSQ